MSTTERRRCERLESTCLYALGALPEIERTAAEAHIAACSECRLEIETLEPIIGAFAAWPTDVLRPSASLWDSVAGRIAEEAGGQPLPAGPNRWTGPEWDEVAPGISVKLLARDAKRERISMLVRLDPGAAYPPHRHAGIEELHLLDGELIIDDRKLHPGDYSRAEAGTSDVLVFSETGCTCVLITSTRDALR